MWGGGRVSGDGCLLSVSVSPSAPSQSWCYIIHEAKAQISLLNGVVNLIVNSCLEIFYRLIAVHDLKKKKKNFKEFFSMSAKPH